uniref:Uncharacterized protein n=1 Tax=Arundo donax TaxID=35708 RepID=A0A0A9F3Q7_ARUDO
MHNSLYSRERNKKIFRNKSEHLWKN